LRRAPRACRLDTRSPQAFGAVFVQCQATMRVFGSGSIDFGALARI
jgi:hypothetical protein